MAATPRIYKKLVAEGSGMLIFSIVFAICIRIIYFYKIGLVSIDAEQSYLWSWSSSFLTNTYVSFAVSSLFVGIIAFLASHINTEYVLIRAKSQLPPALVLLLFSCHPAFVPMSGIYVGLLSFIIVIGILLASYQSERPQLAVFKSSFILALGSLFSPVILVYFPIIWISFIIMRSFSFKSLLTSILGVFIIYFPVYSFYFITGNTETFFSALQLPDKILSLSFSGYDTKNWIVLAGTVLLLSIIIADSFVNRHKDKIRVRAYLSLFLFIVVTSFTLFLFLGIGSQLHLFITMLCGAFLISHFFALAEKLSSVLLFVIMFIFYLFICFSPFLSI